MSGYVTFKEDRRDGRHVELRAVASELRLPPDNAADYAWQVKLGGGGPAPPASSVVYFEIGDTYPMSAIRRLTLIDESTYEQRQRSTEVARFRPYGEFAAAAMTGTR